MPQHTVTTLLNRAARRGIVKRESSRYIRQKQKKPTEDVQAKKASIEIEQTNLADEFRKYALERKHIIDSNEEALRLILGFLEDNHVAILLGAEDMTPREATLTQKEARLVAAFARNVMSHKSDLSRTLQNILEGLVVYNAAFLKDVTSPARQFRGLRVYFDTRILFQLLGYEGDASAILARETLQLLRAAGVQCLAFDKTVFECRGVLKLYENKLASTQGTKELWPIPMTRFFLIAHYGPSDMRQMSALLPQELSKLGIQISPMPKHVPKYTLDERKLAEGLADAHTHDLESPRVIHDVNCASAILTLRRGERSVSLSQVKAVFATSTARVLANVQRWFKDEGESGIGPVVHIRALSNLVWLRRPALAVNLKAHELIALCNAALQPSRRTWDRFIDHLNALERSKAIDSDEAVAIVVSEMTDDLLAQIDDSTDDEDVIDVTTLGEVIDRVRSSYEADAQRRMKKYEEVANLRVSEAQTRSSLVEAEGRQLVTEAHKREHTAAEGYRRLKLTIEGKANSLARIIGWIVSVLLALPVIVGAMALIVGHPIEGGVIGLVIGIALALFVFIELVGILGHINALRSRIETLVLPRLRLALGADSPPPLSASSSVLGLNQAPGDETNEIHMKSDGYA
jgi:chorismate mutase